MRRASGNLPADLTSFVGRRDELTRAKNLHSSSRLLTLTGMGGIGKSRFARQMASEVRRNYPDGVWLVELADLQHGALLAQTIGRALGIRDESSDPVGHLIQHLREQRLLLIIDNCEHLADSCAALISKVLSAAAGVRVIATSRQVLQVEGEQVFPVSSLVHEPRDGPTESMELFEERGSAADPDFNLTEENRDVVATICHRLGGLPLAIELAAARVRTFSPIEILERLSNTELLSTDDPTRPARHRTARAAIEWSLQLCTPEEQRTWEQLSVFSGGFTLDAAETVCRQEESAIASVLIGLVDKSIINRAHGVAGAHARYYMLEPVRQYAAERLAASSEERSVRRRHRDYFLALARRSCTDYCSSNDIEWFAATRQEHANVRAALEFSLAAPGERETGLEMATLLRPFWEQFGSLLEGYRWLTRGLEKSTEPTRIRASALLAAGILGFLLDDNDNARELLDEHLEITRKQQHPELATVALFCAALASFSEGDLKSALGHAEEAVQRGLEGDDAGVVAEAMALSAFYAFVAEDDRAEEMARRFVTYAEGCGSHLLTATALYLAGVNLWRRADINDAMATMREAIRLFQSFEQPGLIAVSTIQGLAWCASAEEPDRAATLFGAAKSMWQYSQMRMSEIATQDITATVESQLRQALGDLGFEQAVATGQELDFDDAVALALGSTAKPRKAPKDAVSRAGLTRREREIAALVADGLTNKEIATKLVISPRTADAHVEHILAKLGFRSRTQIASWFSRQEQLAG